MSFRVTERPVVRVYRIRISDLTKRRRFERAKRRRFGTNPADPASISSFLLRSSFLFLQQPLSLSHLSLAHPTVSLISPSSTVVGQVAGGNPPLLSPLLFATFCTYYHFRAERKFGFLEVFLDEFWLKIYGF